MEARGRSLRVKVEYLEYQIVGEKRGEEDPFFCKKYMLQARQTVRKLQQILHHLLRFFESNYSLFVAPVACLV